MDHRYIDEHSVAERYLGRELSAEEREAFEAHVVDCQECTDRLMLAEMFHARNGFKQKAHHPPPGLTPAPEQEIPLRARFIAHFRPWQLVVIFAAAALLLLAIPTAYFFWELSRLAQP
jgi:anti-sigma factor RsiW